MDSYTLKGILLSKFPYYQKIAEIHQFIVNAQSDEVEVILDISEKLAVSFLFYFSMLPLVAKKVDKRLILRGNEKVIKMLKESGYLQKSLTVEPERTNIAPALGENMEMLNGKGDVLEVASSISQNAPVTMSADVEESFISCVGELFHNAIDHSGSKDVLTAKYLSARRDVYSFSCYDAGVGIPRKIQEIYPEFNSEQALRWALERGNTTVPNKPRGVGLDLLQSFCSINDGKFRIMTNDIVYVFSNKTGAKCSKSKYHFEGTLCEMDINARKELKYVFNYEVKP